MIAHRGLGVPLYDLARHLGLEDDASSVDEGFVLLASAGGRRLGFVLSALTAVERTSVQLLAGAEASGRIGLPAQTIRASSGATCSVLDLAGVIAGLAA